MKPMMNRLLMAAVAIAVIYCVVAGYYSVREIHQRQDKSIEMVRGLIAQEKCILHAGGFISDENGEKFKYTNSVEAMENALLQGDRIIEIDVVETRDGKMVCVHKWKTLLDSNGEPCSKNTTFAQFKGARTEGGFTPMTVDQLAQYMRDNPDLYIVLDVKTPKRWAYSKIAAFYPDLLDRFIAQIYHLRDYDPIHGMGFENLILTLYTADEDELVPEKLKKFAAEEKIVGITMPVRFTKEEYAPIYAALKETGLPLYVHTIDGAEKRQKRLDEGFTAIYSNDVKNDR